MSEATQRKFLRAPLKSTVLYVDGEHVFKARVRNISEGGILLSELACIPAADILPAAINVIQFPRLQSMNYDELKQQSRDDFSRVILKTKLRMVRSFGNSSNVDQVFINYVGCEFDQLDLKFHAAVIEYVDTFTRNIVYLLSLFESLGNRAEQLETLRTVAHLLGYDRRMKVPLLRAKVLHDYQSLESL